MLVCALDIVCAEGTAPFPQAAQRIAAAKSAVDSTYSAIRITVFTEDLVSRTQYCTKAGELRPNFKGETVLCTNDDVLSIEKKKLLKEVLVPEAVNLHAVRLNVKQLAESLSLSGMDKTGACGQFTIPPIHETTGVPDTDFALYVAAGPTNDSTAVWAQTCMRVSADGRPAVGVLNVSPRSIISDTQKIRMIAHELLHALGFNSDSFSRSGIAMTVSSVRGKPNDSPAVSAITATAAARVHYGCISMSYLELEDEGDSEVVGSHWKRRNAKDDLMAPIVGVGYYTAMTMALMEDLGYYTGNYDEAEVMPWGRNAGCGFFEDKCMKDGSTSFPSMFCGDASLTKVCTSDRRGMGLCALETYSTELPTHFQYFSNSMVGGRSGSFTDYCPVIESYTTTRCFDGNADEMFGSVIGEDSRCFSLTNATAHVIGSAYVSVNSICAEVKCGRCSYTVKVKGSPYFFSCNPGSTMSLPLLSYEFQEGFLTCPDFSEVCTDYVNSRSSEGTYTPTCDVETTTLPPTSPPTTASPVIEEPTVGPENVSGYHRSTFASILVATLVILRLLTL